MRLVEKVRKVIRPEISLDDFAALEKKHSVVVTLKESEDFKFILDFFINQREYIRDVVIENKLREVSDEMTIGDSLKRILTQPKEEQFLELSGQYNLIKEFFLMLNKIEKDYKEAQKKINVGR